MDKQVNLNGGFCFVSEFKFDGRDYVEEPFESATSHLSFDKMKPSEFKIFKVEKQ